MKIRLLDEDERKPNRRYSAEINIFNMHDIQLNCLHRKRVYDHALGKTENCDIEINFDSKDEMNQFHALLEELRKQVRYYGG